MMTDGSPDGPVDYIDEVFGEGGFLANRHSGYLPRRGQISMARAVDAVLAGSRTLFVEGPTGTGKSLAYCVPLARHVSQNPGSVGIIVTANNNLLAQIVTKDLPEVAAAVPWRFTFGQLKGLNNYLCLSRWKSAQHPYSPPREKFPEELKRLAVWASRTETGDKNELPEEPPAELWGHLSTTSDGCEGRNCPDREECYGFQSKARAKLSQIVVTNYHLLFLDIRARLAGGARGVLPEWSYLVLDEAHKAADIARDFFARTVSSFEMGRMASAMRKFAPYEAQILDEHSEVFFERARIWAASKKGERAGGSFTRRIAKGEVVADPLGLAKAIENSQKRIALEASKTGGVSDLSNLGRRLGRAARCLEGILSEKRHELDVAYVEVTQRSNIIIGSKPASVAGFLGRGVFGVVRGGDRDTEEEADESGWLDGDGECVPEASERGVVCTSATLATPRSAVDYDVFDGSVPDPFEFMAREMGAGEYEGLMVESPFDFRRQALLVIPDNVPPPEWQKIEGWRLSMSEALVETVRSAEGRTLALFTSWRDLEFARERLRRERLPWTILSQGEAGNSILGRRFREDVHSILLGTESFFTGISIEGEALSCVFIAKLPFPNPSDPVVEQMSEDRSAFGTFTIPRTVLTLKQMIGRLIRTTTDRGVIVITDSRLMPPRKGGKGYGRRIVDALPHARRSTSLEDVGKFLRGEKVGSLRKEWVSLPEEADLL